MVDKKKITLITVNDMSLQDWLDKHTGEDLKQVMRDEIKKKRQQMPLLHKKDIIEVHHFKRASPVRKLTLLQINEEYGGAMLIKYLTGEYSKMNKVIATIYFCFMSRVFTSRLVYDKIREMGHEIPPGDISSRISHIVRSDLGMFFKRSDPEAKSGFWYEADERLALLTVDEAYELYKKTGITGEEVVLAKKAIAPLWEAFCANKLYVPGKILAEKKPIEDAGADEMVHIEDNMLAGLLEILKMHNVKTRFSGKIVIHIGEEGDERE